MLPLDTIVLRLLWGGMLGAAIGVERSYRRRPAGMRTGFCVCMASALFTILSVELARATGDASTTRIASNIVQGIGFLGAGAILKDSAGVAGAATGIVLFGLVVLAWGAQKLNLKPRMMLFRFTTSHADSVASEVQKL